MAGALAAATILGLAAPALAQGQSCFFVSQWDHGWKAADDHTIYLGVSAGRRIFRLDLAGSCPGLTSPSARLITGSFTDTYCTALEWNVSVRLYPSGVPVRCIVSKMTQLTPAQAAALPKNLQP
ncbi:MAG TPA: hypothetical protein VE309_11370 [Caulobacteraceae bacterium]|jgi:hypothetical protein|nr:hypothetical protein [Caulobacteraceae bacterium]